MIKKHEYAILVWALTQYIQHMSTMPLSPQVGCKTGNESDCNTMWVKDGVVHMVDLIRYSSSHSCSISIACLSGVV